METLPQPESEPDEVNIAYLVLDGLAASVEAGKMSAFEAVDRFKEWTTPAVQRDISEAQVWQRIRGAGYKNRPTQP